jgi:hypothetical protein
MTYNEMMNKLERINDIRDGMVKRGIDTPETLEMSCLAVDILNGYSTKEEHNA